MNFIPGKFELNIIDNGKGFNIDKINEHKGDGGLGLKNMNIRAGLIGAVFGISSNQKGTSIMIALPINESTIATEKV